MAHEINKLTRMHCGYCMKSTNKTNALRSFSDSMIETAMSLHKRIDGTYQRLLALQSARKKEPTRLFYIHKTCRDAIYNNTIRADMAAQQAAAAAASTDDQEHAAMDCDGNGAPAVAAGAHQTHRQHQMPLRSAPLRLSPDDLSLPGFVRHLNRLKAEMEVQPLNDGIYETATNFAAARQFFRFRVLLVGETAPTLCKFDEQTIYEQHPIDVARGDRDDGGRAATAVMQKVPRRSGHSDAATAAAAAFLVALGDEIDSFGITRLAVRTDLIAATVVLLQFYSDQRWAIFNRQECVLSGKFRTLTDVLDITHRFFSHQLCPGIELEVELTHGDTVLKSAKPRIGDLWAHTSCTGFIENVAVGDAATVADTIACGPCRHCRQLRINALQQRRRAAQRAGTERADSGATSSSSRVPFSILSDMAKEQRLRSLRDALKASQRRIREHAKPSPTLLTPMGDMSDEENTFRAKMILYAALEERQAELFTFLDRDESGVLAEHFLEDLDHAIRFLKGGNAKFGARWSTSSFRVAMAVYLKSPAAYRELQKSQHEGQYWPSERQIKAKIAESKVHEGIDREHLQRQQDEYTKFLRARAAKHASESASKATVSAPVTASIRAAATPSSAAASDAASASHQVTAAEAASANALCNLWRSHIGNRSADADNEGSDSDTDADASDVVASNFYTRHQIPTSAPALASSSAGSPAIASSLSSSSSSASASASASAPRSAWTAGSHGSELGETLQEIFRRRLAAAGLLCTPRSAISSKRSSSDSAPAAPAHSGSAAGPSTAAAAAAAAAAEPALVNACGACRANCTSVDRKIECERCQSVRYCSHHCRQQQWHTHRQECVCADYFDQRLHRDGELCWDAVKLSHGVVFNSNGLEIRGLCASHEDLRQMHDIYESLKRGGHGEEARYAFQFMWSSSTNSFRFLAPFFMMPREPTGVQVYSFAVSVIEALYNVGFNVNLCVCDGASTNLAAIALLTGYGIGNKQRNDDDFEKWLLRPRGVHPLTGRPIFFIIDPVHQLKSVRNWLANSNCDGSHRALLNLDSNGVERQLLWEHVSCLPNMDAPLGSAHNLKLSDVDMKSSFKRMWVAPAANVINPRVAAHLFDLNTPNATRARAWAWQGNAGATAKFIQVFGNLFHLFFLKADLYLYSLEHPAWQYVDAAEQFMREWALFIQERAQNTFTSTADRTSFRDKAFLAWQSIRCIMLLLQGYREYARDFFDRHPGFYLCPKRTSQSHLESFFSFARSFGGDVGYALATHYPSAVNQFGQLAANRVLAEHLQHRWRAPE